MDDVFLTIAAQRLELALAVNFATTIQLYLFPILPLTFFIFDNSG
jgi:hypothetical protein